MSAGRGSRKACDISLGVVPTHTLIDVLRHGEACDEGASRHDVLELQLGSVGAGRIQLDADMSGVDGRYDRRQINPFAHPIPLKNKDIAPTHRTTFLQIVQNRNFVLGQVPSFVTNTSGKLSAPQSLTPRRSISRSRDIRPYADQSLTNPIPLSTHIRGETTSTKFSSRAGAAPKAASDAVQGVEACTRAYVGKAWGAERQTTRAGGATAARPTAGVTVGETAQVSRFGATSSALEIRGRYRAADAAFQTEGERHAHHPDHPLIQRRRQQTHTIKTEKHTRRELDLVIDSKTLASVQAGGKPAPNSYSHIRGETSRGVGQ